MAKGNKLLGSGIPDEVEIEVEVKPVTVQQKAPAWRYHKDHPEGKVCRTDMELAMADAKGWQDHPGKVRKFPGLEYLYIEPEVEEPEELSKIDISPNEDK